MSEGKPEGQGHNEIIIVRRGGHGDHDAHHGGVWKIAFADFMTAMMAFFLVMWLINSTSQETKTVVANYFNPIKLVDSQSKPRGLQENENPNTEGIENKEGASKEVSKTQTAKQTESQNDAIESSADQVKMMNEPYETLDQIAEVSQSTDTRFDGQGGAQQGGSRSGANQGMAYQDPFSPEYWSANVSPENLTLADEANVKTGENAGHALQIQAMIEAGNAQPAPGQDEYKPVGGNENGIATQPNPNIAGMGGETAGGLQNAQVAQVAQNAQASSTAEQTAQDQKNAQNAQNAQSGQNGQSEQMVPNAHNAYNDGNVTATMDANNKGQDVKAATGNALPTEADAISSELAELLDKQPGGLQPIVRVIPTDDGVAIELMDQANYGMFAVGSSKPDKRTVDLLAGVAKILAGRKGDIIVSGHTDARPYRSSTYDNWQLSSARAQMAYYMLVRGGLDEKRILRVEGYAERDLKNKSDPYAAENRRIQIFLRNPPRVMSAGNNQPTANGGVANPQQQTSTQPQGSPSTVIPASVATPVLSGQTL